MKAVWSHCVLLLMSPTQVQRRRDHATHVCLALAEPIVPRAQVPQVAKATVWALVSHLEESVHMDAASDVAKGQLIAEHEWPAVGEVRVHNRPRIDRSLHGRLQLGLVQRHQRAAGPERVLLRHGGARRCE